MQLLKLNVPELSLYSASAFAMLGPLTRRGIAIGVGFLLFTLCCSTLTIVLDDIAGYVDGVDQITVTASKRNIIKPLLTGTLSLDDAWRAAWAVFTCAALLGAALAAWSGLGAAAVPLLAVFLGLVTQYSYGLKLSYHGLGEAVIVAGTAASVLIPCMLWAPALPPTRAWCVALICGLPYAAQLMCSNAIDHDGDKAAGRLTLTVRWGLNRAPRLAAGFLIAFWSGVLIGLVTGVLPSICWLWLPLALGHWKFWRMFRGGRLIDARLLSFRLVRVQLVAFPLALALGR